MLVIFVVDFVVLVDAFVVVVFEDEDFVEEVLVVVLLVEVTVAVSVDEEEDEGLSSLLPINISACTHDTTIEPKTNQK